MARSSDGTWLPLAPQRRLDPELALELLGEDLQPLLGLPAPTPIVARSPDLPGSPDALAVTGDGHVLAVLCVDDDPDALTSARASAVVRGLQRGNVAQLAAASDLLGQDETLGMYVAERAGGDAATMDRSIEAALQHGGVLLIVVACAGHRHVARAVVDAERELDARIYCYDVPVSQAGDVVLAELVEVSVAQVRSSARRMAERSDHAQFLKAAVAECGAQVEDSVEALLRHTESFYSVARYEERDGAWTLSAWMDDPSRGAPAFKVSSAGVVGISLVGLEGEVRRELVTELAALCDVDVGVATGPAWNGVKTVRLTLGEHLTDVSLVERCVGAVSDALLTTVHEQLRVAA